MAVIAIGGMVHSQVLHHFKPRIHGTYHAFVILVGDLLGLKALMGLLHQTHELA